MAFSFKEYGTFSGPGAQYTFRENDDFTNIFEDPTFNLDDVSMVLLSTPSDYVYLHLDGTSTANVTLERSTGPITQFFVDATLSVFNGDIQTSYIPSLNTKAAFWDSKKSFDITHPTKENHRLRYICLEGPQAEVYLRGKLINQYVIELPDYWRELVDAETIGVTLTPVGSYQELYVEKVELGTHITIKNSAGGAINCTYIVYGERKDTSRNIPEYEGTSPKDYPGDNREYSINSGNKNWT
jgi:hypothetical protein